jgi:hypothetical protein
MAPVLNTLTCMERATRWLIMQKARGHPARRLPLLVSVRFQELFHSPPGVLFTFPSQYWFTIGHRLVFSLDGWSRQIPTRFLVSRGTWEINWSQRTFRLRACHPLWRIFPNASTIWLICNSMEIIRNFLLLPQPRCHNALTLDMTPV